MQRLHEDDMTGHVLKEGGWTHVCIPGEAERDEDIVFPSGRIVHRTAGSVLWPDRENAEQIALVKTRLGSYGYAGQYQQRPSPIEGGLLKREWWRFYRESELPALLGQVDGEGLVTDPTPRFDEEIQSWDLAVKDTSDYVCGLVVAKKGARRFVRDCVHERLDFSATIPAIRRVTVKWPRATAKIVEDKANGPAVLSVLKGEIPGLIAFNPQGDKFSRAAAISPEVEAGNWYLPHPDDAPWVREFIEECVAFPNASHDDYVDAWSQAGIRYQMRPTYGYIAKPAGW
jgi:predicted phage terminase large subunit-like protein